MDREKNNKKVRNYFAFCNQPPEDVGNISDLKKKTREESDYTTRKHVTQNETQAVLQ